MKKTISITLVIVWMIIIFIFSSFNGKDSRNTSVGLLNSTVKIVSNTLYKIKIINKPLTADEIDNIANKLNYPVRKMLHVFEYFVLALLVYNALINFKLKNIYTLTILISVLYSTTDEFHQLFTGRTGTIIDVFIDSIGIILAILLIKITKKIRQCDV